MLKSETMNRAADDRAGGCALFSRTAGDELVRALTGARGAAPGAALGALANFAQEEGLSGNLWQGYLAALLAADENAYSLAAERAPAPTGSLRTLALRDAAWLRTLFSYQFPNLSQADRALLLAYEGGREADADVPNPRREKLLSLRDALAGAGSDGAFLDALAAFYGSAGVGQFALFDAFRFTPDGLEPIRQTRRVRFDDLVGYETQKRLLIENTERFLAGEPANHVLLYGDGGTGKSTSIQALLTRYASRGLRMVEVGRNQYDNIEYARRCIAGRNYRFILVLDDLSFEEQETGYKSLKSFFEGGIEPQPENLLIYATSNRRHLVHESWNDRDDYDTDLHRSETTEEKLSLASRFGLSILYLTPSQQEFLDIVTALAARAGIALPQEELRARAIAWKMHHAGSVTPRTAQQFIASLPRG